MALHPEWQSDYDPSNVSKAPQSVEDLAQYGITDELIRSNPRMRAAGITNSQQFWDKYQTGSAPNFGLAKDDPMGDLVLAGLMTFAAAGMGGMLPGTTPVWGAPAAASATAGGPPASYWNMLADAGGVASDAAPAAAGAVDAGTSLSGVANYGIPGTLGTAASEFGGSLATGSEMAGANAMTAGGTLAGPALEAGAVGAGTSLADLAKYGMGASALTGLGGAYAATSAANTAANASNRATDAQLGMFNTINQQQQPWRQAGVTALGDIAGMKDYFNHQFNANDLNANLAPNYQFMLDQGLGAVRNQMNRAGGLYGGNTLKAINDYAQNYAGNAYQQAFNNYTTNQSNIFNRLSNIAGLGQTANANVGQAGSTISGNAAQTMVGAGQAQAAGTMGVANSLTSGANNAMGWYALPQFLNYGSR